MASKVRVVIPFPWIPEARKTLRETAFFLVEVMRRPKSLPFMDNKKQLSSPRQRTYRLVIGRTQPPPIYVSVIAAYIST